MILLTVNSGSTSVKLAAYEAADRLQSLAFLEEERHRGESLDPPRVLATFAAKFRPRQIAAIGHRVVHGGERFARPTRIDDDTYAALSALSDLAPLHNPLALKWIDAARSVAGADTVHVAVFDTAFFARLPRVAAEYALPASIGTALGIRRYGFHGIAHEAMWRRWCEREPRLPLGGRLITLQLGGGCSITATDRGCPIDTSMGFTPLEGLVMATRSGDVDPAIIPFLSQHLALSGERVIELLNSSSGLLGLSGGASSLGELVNRPDAQAQFAIELYCYRARKYVGAYLAALGGCDGIVFGGGVGENVPEARERILRGMQWAGIELDRAANLGARGAEARISTADSRVSVCVIPGDEQRALAEAALSVLKAG